MSNRMSGRAAVFSAVATPARLAILEALRAGAEGVCPAMTVTEVAAATDLSRFAASRHLRLLCEAGLIEVSRHGAALLHVLRPAGFGETEDWLYPFVDLPVAGTVPAAATT